MTNRPQPTLGTLTQDLVANRLNRRQFVMRAAALGLSASAIAGALAACGGTVDTPTNAPIATSAPTVVPTSAGINTGSVRATATTAGGTAPTAAVATTTRPVVAATPSAASGGPTKRGGGGQLKILQSQAPVNYNPHLSSGTKDDLIGRIVYEPLCTIDINGNILPILAAEVPTDANGGVAADGKSVTYKLKQGVKWSDGQPFNADDVVFTYQYVTDEATAATSVASYINIASVQKIDTEDRRLHGESHIQRRHPRLVRPLLRCRRQHPAPAYLPVRQGGGGAQLAEQPQASRHRAVQGDQLRPRRLDHLRDQ